LLLALQDAVATCKARFGGLRKRKEKVYSPQYNKYVALNNDSNKKWRVARKAQGPG